MAIDFPSQEWLEALMKVLNDSESYQESAKNWEGDFYFVFEPEGGLKERVIGYMDLWHGKCRASYIVDDEKEKNPEFIISAPVGKWRKIIEKKLNPIQGM